ncbi:MAG: beta-CASP ribonuclease aCPSF1 [archaeon]
MDYFKDIKDKIENALNEKNVKFSKIEAEGPEVAIYTTDPLVFFDNKDLIGSLAEILKKRINIRSEKTILMDPAEALELIKKIIPETAEIKSIFFDPVFSEVVIEAVKPGIVIGKNGFVSKEIIRQTKWIPKILRSPIENSETLKGIRTYLLKHSSDRKTFLKDVANKIYSEQLNDKEWIRVTALGGFREVGRSCMLLETPNKKILLDCGLNHTLDEETPFFEALRFPLDELDAVIISHAHIDHCGFLPYLFKVGYRGPVYCTEPTRDLMALLQFDIIDVYIKNHKEPLYSEEHVRECIKHCITRNYRDVTDIAPGIRLTFHDAAHILGSASVHLHIGDGLQNLVYSADFKYGFTRLFNNMDISYPRLETVIMESTYGGKKQDPLRMNSEQNFLNIINETVETGGICLIPVFSVGRAQEVMLVLEEFYRMGKLKTNKVFIDGMTREASAIHTVYPEYMKKNIKTRVLQNNSPFQSDLFLSVGSGKSRDDVINTPGSIILASSGMLTGGPSLHYFYQLAEDPKNCIIFAGYQASGTLGYRLQKGMRSIPITDEGNKTRVLEVKLRVESQDGFSGHSYKSELINYLNCLKPKPKLVVVNHGDSCVEFAKFLSEKCHVNAKSIQNLEAVRLV